MSLSKLATHPRPVDAISARVAFYRGAHFAPAPRATQSRTHTWRYPPDVVGTPGNHEPDWTGHANGLMTALYWYRPGKHGRPAVWVVRCSCGNYEARVPQLWNEFLEKRWRGKDRCEACKDTAVATGAVACSPQKHNPERRNKWINSMLSLGLSVDEIAALMVSDVRTAGCTAAQIRAALAASTR